MSIVKNEKLQFFCGRLIRFREELGLTVGQMADKIGIPLTTYAEAEKGRQPKFFFFSGFAIAFPADLFYLLTGEKPDTVHLTKGYEEEERALLEWYRKAHHYDKEAVRNLIRRDAEQKRNSADGQSVRKKGSQENAE